MSRITDELRDWVSNNYSGWLSKQGEGFAIAYRIDAEYEKAIRELNNLADASVLLPVDADGEVIHVGDAMERGDAHGRVIALMLSNNPWGEGNHWAIQLECEHAPTVLDAFFHHYHEPTVEDVLDEMLQRFAEDSYEGDLTDFIASYATKLQLKED